MAQIKTIDTVAGENQIDFKRRYSFVWLKNLGDADVYISDKAGIVAEADGVVLLGAGQAAMLENYDDCVYVLGATTIEAHGQHSADSPFGDTIVAGGGGGGGGGTIESLTVTQNGIYTASGGVDGYSPVTVNVSPNVDTKSVTQNGTYRASADELDGYSVVTVEVPDPPAPVLIEKTITQNGVYDPEDDNADGYSMIDVEVAPNVSSKSINTNGTYTASSENLDGYSSVTVTVPQTTIESLSVTNNGTYTAISGKAFSPVVVNVPTGPEIITRANWDLMTESQKQAKGLVAIQDSSTGFLRGDFVNGADYIQRNKYIPYSDEYKIIGVAYPDLFDASANSWGYGTNPVLYSGTGGKPTLSTQEQAILFPTNTSDVVGYVDLGAINTPFTAYIVMKCISPAGRILCCTEQASMNRLIMLNGDGDNVSVDSWGSGSSLGVSAVSDYFVAAMTSSVTTGYGYAYDAANDTVNSMNKSLSATGRYITIGRTDIDPNVMYPSPTDLYLKYIAVVSEVENGTTIINNIRNLYNQFVASE